jgi:hypothetical protein
MKEALTRVFQYYGPILDIIAKSSLKRKGQAFVVFDSEKSALEAVEEMNGFEMYGKAMNVRKAKTHSDETVKRKATEMFEEHKRKRLMAKGMFPAPPHARRILTMRRDQAGRRRQKGGSQPCSRCREAPRSKDRSRSCPRRIRAPEQDALPPEHPPRCRRRRPHDHLRAFRRLQRSAPGVGQVRGLCRIRERAVRNRGQRGDSQHSDRRGRQAHEGHIPAAVDYCIWIFACGFYEIMIPHTASGLTIETCCLTAYFHLFSQHTHLQC